MPNPKVSIIIPNYNHAQFLDKRIESVLNQSFQDFEIILLDDCSTDDSLDVLGKYKIHPKVAHFEVNEQNSGSVFKQWVKGIELSKGEYIWIAESDDVAHPDFLLSCIKFLKDEIEALAVFCPSIEIDESGAETGNTLGPTNKKTGFEINTKLLIAQNLVRKLVIGNASGVLFRSNSFKYLNFDILKKFANTGDRYTYIQLALNGPISFLNKKLNYYRNHCNNTTKKNNLNNKIFLDRVFIIEYLIPIFSENKLARQLLMEFYFRKIFVYLYVIPFSKNQEIINNLYLNNYFNVNTKNKIIIYNYILIIFKRLKPYKLRVFYKKMIYDKLCIEI